jgi:hypothetical protein
VPPGTHPGMEYMVPATSDTALPDGAIVDLDGWGELGALFVAALIRLN